MDTSRPAFSRFDRVAQGLRLAIVLVGTGLAIYWLVKLLRGDPDQYPNEILGGLSLSAGLVFLAGSDFLRGSRMRWVSLGLGLIAVAVTWYLIARG